MRECFEMNVELLQGYEISLLLYDDFIGEALCKMRERWDGYSVISMEN